MLIHPFESGMYEWIISLIAALAAVGAFVYTAKSFMRLRKTEQVRLSESIWRDIRSLAKEYTILSATTVSDTEEQGLRQRKLDRMLDHTFASLDWYCFLIKTGEINDKSLLNYAKGTIIKWHDNFFVKDVGVEITSDETMYPYFRSVYQKFKKEEEDKLKSGENRTAGK